MKFEPAPHYDFSEFWRIYYQRCQRAFPQLVAIAAKWQAEDLIPGLSDFDTRLIYADPMRIRDWLDVSKAIGEVHIGMAFEFPHWARNLEHPPGLNLTIQELVDPPTYYPEYQQWTFYDGEQETLDKICSAVEKHLWGPRDELYHLRKVAMLFGPYARGIDPPINLGPYKNKYALHSRLMHYFTPCLQSMVSLRIRKNMPGKRAALLLAEKLFPHPETIGLALEAIDLHYELPSWYQEPKLTQIESELEAYLAEAWSSLDGNLTLIQPEPNDSRECIASRIAALAADPVEQFFNSTRFARQMRGRLLFYAQRIPWFDSAWLIRNELARIATSLYERPTTLVGLLLYKKELEPDVVLDRLEGEMLSPSLCEGFRRFAKIASTPIEPGRERDASLAVSDCCDPVLEALSVMGDIILNKRLNCRITDSHRNTISSEAH